MEFGVNRPRKIVWLCHFSNAAIQEQLRLKKQISEFAPWITLGIEEVKKRKDIELHVIAPHRWLSKKTFFRDGNIQYYFFNSGVFGTGRHWPVCFKLDYWTNFYQNRKTICSIVDSINPDIIHLHGAENPYYSTAILDLYKKWPVLLTIQGFGILNGFPDTYIKRRNFFYEKKILATLQNFGVRNRDMVREIMNHNSSAKFFWHEYFLNDSRSVNGKAIPWGQRKFDLVFFARVAKAKGVEDVIKTVSLLMPKYPNIKAAIIGASDSKYSNYLERMVSDFECTANIDFVGFLPTQEEVYKIVENSRISVLPTYNDIIPGTIIESMLRRIPVVSYATGGIPEINSEQTNISLVKQGDVLAFSSEVDSILSNESKALELVENSYKYATARWCNENSLQALSGIYSEIIRQFSCIS